MNLYDKDDGFRQFTLSEANALLPQIIATTQESMDKLDAAKAQLESDKVVDEATAYDRFEEESALILQEWAERMVELKVYPKGYFTVDFKSPIPDTLFCWTHGEEIITHTHKTFESFKNRIPISSEDRVGFEDSLN